MRVRHYWRKHVAKLEGARAATPECDAPGTLAMLKTGPEPALGWFSRVVAFLTTPFKRLGISGWKETGCWGRGIGRPVRDAQHSTDGFYTIDVALDSLAIGPEGAPAGRFLRLEIEPGTLAHETCAATPVKEGVRLAFGGALVVDTDGPFLEIHPDEDFEAG